jgi:membrane protein YdbS with pleckstrin-like domain
MAVVHEVEDGIDLELPEAGAPVTYRCHWQLFVPTIIVLAGYGFALWYLWMTGRSDLSLFRLFAIVMAVGVPLLAAHAFLRYETVRVQLLPATLRYHPGWPKDMAIEIPRELITGLYVKRGLAGRLFGGGTLIIKTSTGNRIAIADLKNPQDIVSHFEDEPDLFAG